MNSIYMLALTLGQCSGGNCYGPPAGYYRPNAFVGNPAPLVMPAAQPVAQPVAVAQVAYTYQPVENRPGWFSINRGHQVGAYNREDGTYHPRNADGSFAAATVLPADLPAWIRDGIGVANGVKPAPDGGVTIGSLPPGGVTREKMSKKPEYTVNGQKRPTIESVYTEIMKEGITDDSAHRRLYITHPDAAERLRLKAQAESAVLQSGQTDIAVLALSPKDYLVAEYGFNPDPAGLTLYLVAPGKPGEKTAKEIWREQSWPDAATLQEGLRMKDTHYQASGIPGFAVLAEGLRGLDPSYDKSKSGGIRGKAGASDPTTILLVGVGLVLAIAFLKRRSD